MPTKITFLLGAGASVPAGVPHVRKFYQDFRSHLHQQLGGRHELVLCLECLEIAWKEEAGITLSDLERLYEALTFLNAGTTTSIPLRLPPGFPVRSREIELLEWELKKYVQQRCLSVRPKDLDYLRPILKFITLTQPRHHLFQLRSLRRDHPGRSRDLLDRRSPLQQQGVLRTSEVSWTFQTVLTFISSSCTVRPPGTRQGWRQSRAGYAECTESARSE
jgi:hypothetical protein